MKSSRAADKINSLQILDILGSREGKERVAEDFCTWIEVQVMTDLIAALPQDKQNQVIDRFMTLPAHKKESVFFPYYTVEHMRKTLLHATKKAIAQQIVEPKNPQLTPSQRERILALLEQLT
jgi:hypothetical protein